MTKTAMRHGNFPGASIKSNTVSNVTNNQLLNNGETKKNIREISEKSIENAEQLLTDELASFTE